MNKRRYPVETVHRTIAMTMFVNVKIEAMLKEEYSTVSKKNEAHIWNILTSRGRLNVWESIFLRTILILTSLNRSITRKIKAISKA